MLIALNRKNKKIKSFETNKSKKPFYCPECNDEVILKAGNIKIPHFAHKVNSDKLCSNESEEHLTIKFQIYKYLLKKFKKFGYEIDLEKKFPNNRADVFFKGNKYKIAIEIQCSPISYMDALVRLCNYDFENIYSLWVFPYDTKRIFLNSEMINRQTYFYKDEDANFIPCDYDFKFIKLKAHEIYFSELYKRNRIIFWCKKQKIFKIVKYSKVFSKGDSEYSNYPKLLKTVKKIDSIDDYEITKFRPLDIKGIKLLIPV